MLSNCGISSEIQKPNAHLKPVLTKDHLGVKIPGDKCFKNGQHSKNSTSEFQHEISKENRKQK